MDMNGWDVVCACSQDKLNGLLAKRLSATPPLVDYKDADGNTLKATFAPWQIVPFGSSDRLTMVLPIKTGTLHLENRFAATPDVTLDGVQVEIEVDLDFVDNATGTAKDLKFDLTAKAGAGSGATKGVGIQNIDLTGALAKADPSGTAAGKLGTILPECLVANRDKLAFVLASLDLAPTGDASWMTPKEVEYLFVQGPKDAKGNQQPGYLAILSMVRDLPSSKRKRAIDPSLCDDRSDVCMAFASDVFLEQMVIPGLSDAFPGNAAGTFHMMGDDIAINPLVLCPEVDHMGTGYHPILTTMYVSIDGSRLKSSVTGLFHVTGLTQASVSFSSQTIMTCTYDPAKGGLVMTKVGGEPPDWHKHIPWWEEFVFVFGGVIVLAIVDSVIASVVDAVGKKVASSNQTKGIADWTFDAVSWPGSDAIDVKEGALEGALWLRGTLK